MNHSANQSVILNQSAHSSEVFDRLSQLQHLPQSKKLAGDANIDPKTGQPLFRPQTGRSPKNHARRISTGDGAKQSIGDHLYGQHKTLLAKQA